MAAAVIGGFMSSTFAQAAADLRGLIRERRTCILELTFISQTLGSLVRFPLAEATIYFERGFPMAAAMIGGPTVAVAEGLLLRLASRILG